MRLDPHTHAMLVRMDPAEILIWLALQGQLYKPERGFASKEDMLRAERRVMLAAGHKARLACGRAFSKRLRQQSKKWLAENGFSEPTATHL